MNSLPKRRKYKDNLYTLSTIDNHYYILFRDSSNIPRIVEVKKEIYDIFNQFELDDLKELNEYDRHIEHLELTDENIYKKGINNEDGIDDLIIRNSTYDEFAKLAKNSHSINFIKIDEDCSYNTALPYNRYQMLTAANPLYEGLVVVRFDERGKLAEAIRLGVKKIYCETV